MSHAEAHGASKPLAPAWRWGLATYFVTVWGSGFVASRYALQYASPFTYIAVRYWIAFAVAIVLFGLRARWPTRPADWGHAALAGLLTHGAYLGGSHYAQRWGLSAGVTALVLALQPLATAVLVAVLFAERLGRLQVAGIAVGLGGVALVVFDRVDGAGLTPASVAAVVWALASVTAGTLYQRYRCAGIDLRAATCIHLGTTAIVMLPLAVAVEGFAIRWNAGLAVTLVYHVVFASIGAFSVLLVLLRRGEATGVTSLLYLTPPVAVLCEWAVFGVPPTPVMWAGMIVACVGVAMVTWRRKSAAPAEVLEEPS